MSTPKLPEVLEKIVDKVLAYHPKPKSKAAKKRKLLTKEKKQAKSRATTRRAEPSPTKNP